MFRPKFQMVVDSAQLFDGIVHVPSRGDWTVRIEAH